MDESTQWVKVDPDGLAEGQVMTVVAGGRALCLTRTAEGYGALDNRCPHQGGPLCDGIVTASSVVCPLHAWKVNLATGSVERPAGGRDHCVATYPVRVEDGIVVIGLPVRSDTIPAAGDGAGGSRPAAPVAP